MTEKDRLVGYSKVCLNGAFVLQLSWIPTLMILEGSSRVSPNIAGYAHMAALGFMVAAPLAFGLRVRREAPEATRDWALRCLFPPVAFAAATQFILRLAPHVTLPLIVGLMVAVLPLGVYGVILRREAARTFS